MIEEQDGKQTGVEFTTLVEIEVVEEEVEVSDEEFFPLFQTEDGTVTTISKTISVNRMTPKSMLDLLRNILPI